MAKKKAKGKDKKKDKKQTKKRSRKVLDNPFGAKPSIGEAKKAVELKSKTVKETKDVVEPPEHNASLHIIQKVLAEHNNIESDIPLTHPEYWHAKRNL